MRPGLFVSELARKAEVDPWTIRYYEKEGLIPSAPRSAARYRVYPPETADLIQFIKTAQGLGLTLEEIKKVIEAKRLKGKPCDHVVKLLETKIGDLHQRIKEMEELRKTIQGLLRNWKKVRRNKTTCICEIIESVGREKGGERRWKESEKQKRSASARPAGPARRSPLMGKRSLLVKGTTS